MTRHNLSVSLRRSESYVFSDVKAAKKFEKQPDLNLCFEPENADDKNEKFKVKPIMKLTELKPLFLELSRHGKIVDISAEFLFIVEVDEACGCDEFDEWSSEEGGWSTVYFEPIADWEQNEDFDGSTYFGTRDSYGFLLDGNED